MRKVTLFFFLFGISLLLQAQYNPETPCKEETQIALHFIYGNKAVQQNVAKGLEQLQSLANTGCAYAQFKLGYLYYKADYDYRLKDSKRYQNIYKLFNTPNKAFAFIEKASNQDYLPATIYLGKLYQLGLGCTLNYTKAMELYKEAYQEGDNRAAYAIGYNYFKGLGSVEQNYTKAIEWFTKTNYPMARHYLAICYYFGYGTAKNKEKAYELLVSIKGNLNSPTLLAHLQNNANTTTSGILSDFRGEDIAQQTEEVNKVLTAENEDAIDTATNEAPLINNQTITGTWTGKLIDLDYSGERILRSFPASISFSTDADTGGVTCQTTINNQQTKDIAVLLDNSLYFQNLKLHLPRLYKDHPKIPNFEYQLLSANLEVKTINHVQYLSAYVETKNKYNNEPGSPKLLILTNTSIKTANGVEISEALINALLKSQGDNFITLYPNPFKSDLLIQYELSEEALTNVELYSLDGLFSKTIVNNETQSKGKKLYHFNGSQLELGLYVVRVTANAKTYTKLIVKE